MGTFAVPTQAPAISLQIPTRARCRATPLRSVQEKCLLLTSPFIEPSRPVQDYRHRHSVTFAAVVRKKELGTIGSYCIGAAEALKFSRIVERGLEQGFFFSDT